MAITVTHKFVSAKADSSDLTLVNPTNWNDTHNVTANIPFVNVKDFGAVGDGLTNDTGAWLNCIASGAINIYAPASIYRITSTLTLPPTCIIQGDGGYPVIETGTRFKFAFAGPLFYATKGTSKVRLHQLRIDGQSVVGSIGIQLGDADDPASWAVLNSLDDIAIINCDIGVLGLNTWGLDADRVFCRGNLSKGAWIHPPTVYASGAPTTTSNPPSVGGYTTTILFRNHCQFDFNGENGLLIDGNNNDVTVTDCLFDNNSGPDFEQMGTCRILRFQRNYVESLQPLGFRLHDGLALTGYAFNATGALVVEDNFFQAPYSFGNNVVTARNNRGNTSKPNIQDITTVPLTNDSTYGVAGPELLTNGSFSGSGTGWAFMPGWAYGSNNAVATAADGFNALWQNVHSIPDLYYQIIFDMTVTAGQCYVQFGGIYGDSISISGTYRLYVRATIDDVLYFRGLNGFTGTVDNVSLRLITPTSIATPTFIVSETGSNTAIVGTLASGIPQAAGLTVRVLLAHTLQAGANTFNYNGNGAVAIKSHRNPATNIAAAYTAGCVIELTFDGTVWQDVSQ